jgi:hypothetical protein
MVEYFSFDDRLGILLPNLEVEWDQHSFDTQQNILLQWEQIRGSIPDRIFELEEIINKKQAQLSDESNFPRSCELNSEIAALASIINDLWLWHRADQNLSAKTHH